MSKILSSSVKVITIDGPSGSGKGTLSQMLAKHLAFNLLDSGALYRLVALAAMKQATDLQNQSLVAAVAEKLDVVFDLKNEKTRILLAGDDVTDMVRFEQVGMNASLIAAYPMVRAALLARQRAFAVAPGLVADGRDMGTTVFPEARLKIFLTASVEARARRRFKQLIDRHEEVSMAALIKDLAERDDRDINRSISPLRPAADALIIDSTEMSINEVFDAILDGVKSC